MDAFKKVIGYESIKEELYRILDMLQNRELFTSLGAKLPKGLLLHGAPGLGKTLLAKSFIEASGLPVYTLRKTRTADNFLEEIDKAFETARENAPAIVFLDDLDKFANEDMGHCDAEEYVAVQAGIDACKDYDVFALATANQIRKLPQSLCRAGRFDRTVFVQAPAGNDAKSIIEYYLSDKKVSDDVNCDDLAAMMSYTSCAELESMLNEAAISAAHARKGSIEMDDIIRAVLREQYGSSDDCSEKNENDVEEIAVHETGHLIVSEVLCPGSVGLASIRKRGRNRMGGFVHRCKDLGPMENYVLAALGGKAAVETCSNCAVAYGCSSDIEHAKEILRGAMINDATHGFSLVDPRTEDIGRPSEDALIRQETVVQSEFERLYRIARNIIFENMDAVQAVSEALKERETLTRSEIQKILNGVAKKRERAAKRQMEKAMKLCTPDGDAKVRRKKAA